jgi:hypothetical protein
MKLSIRIASLNLVLSFALVAACLGQQSSSPQSGAKDKSVSNSETPTKIVRSDGSTITGSHYWNPYFGFSIELPKGWVIVPQQEVETMQKKNVESMTKNDPELVEEAARARMVSAPPLVVVENDPRKEGFERRGVELLASDVSGEAGPLSGDAFFKAAAQMMREKKLPVEYTGALEKVNIEGRTLWKAKLKETTNGHVQYVRQYVAILKKCAVQYLLIGPDDAGLEDLESVIQTLHFSSSPN